MTEIFHRSPDLTRKKHNVMFIPKTKKSSEKSLRSTETQTYETPCLERSFK